MALSFRSSDGGLLTEDLADAWARPFEWLEPVRRLVQYKGQRNFTGSWWFATTGDHVGFESWVERDNVMLLDFTPAVVGVGSQPFSMMLETADGTRRHVPDYFVREADGSGTVIDVRPDELVGDDAIVFDATADACSLVGWRYQRLGTPASVLAENVRWLAGYRHTRCARPDLRGWAVELAAQPIGLGDLARALGDPVVTLPSLFHLLWTHDLRAELDSTRLSLNAVVRADG